MFSAPLANVGATIGRPRGKLQRICRNPMRIRKTVLPGDP